MQRAGSPAALPHAPPGELPAPREPCTKPRPPGTSQREPGSPPAPPKRKGEGERGTEGRLRPRGVYPPSPPASLRAEPSCSSLQPGPELGPGAPLLIPAAPLARRQPPPSLRGGGRRWRRGNGPRGRLRPSGERCRAPRFGAGKGRGGTEPPVPQPEATPGAQWGCAVCYFGVFVK